MTEPQGVGPVRYRYHFTDLTGRLLATLPLLDASLSDVIGAPAGGAGVVPLTAQEVAGQDPFGATERRRRIMWAERQVLDQDARLVVSRSYPWAGLVLGRKTSRTKRALSLSLVTWPGYYEHRLLPNLPFYGYDTLDVFRGILDYGTSQTPGFTGTTSTGGRVGPIIDQTTRLPIVDPFDTSLLVGGGSPRQYVGRDKRTALKAAQDLASEAGFDWRFVPYVDPTAARFTPRLRLDIGRPRLGRVAPPEIRWSADRRDNRSQWGYLEDYTLDEDGSKAANRMVGMAGTGGDGLSVTVTALDLGIDEVGQGYPIFEAASGSSGSEIATVDDLRAVTRGNLAAALASEVRLSGVKVSGHKPPTLDLYSVGDDATIRTDPELHGGVDLTIVGQIIARTITPPQQGRTEGVTFDLQGA